MNLDARTPPGAAASSGTARPQHRPAVRVLPYRDPALAARLAASQRAAYGQQAGLIGSTATPPLHEAPATVMALDLVFLGVAGATLQAALGYRVCDGVLDLDRVMVAPEAVRRGLGRRLVSFALAVVPHRTAEVTMGRANERARRLYEGLGFVQVGACEPIPDVAAVRYRRAA